MATSPVRNFDMRRRREATCWLHLMGCLIGASSLCACDSPTKQPVVVPDPLEHSTRFDEMGDRGTARQRVSADALDSAMVEARHDLHAVFDRAFAGATTVVLGQDPRDMQSAEALGELVGTAEISGPTVTLRLADGKKFAAFPQPRLETQPCWSTLWQPDWSPVAAGGPGVGVEAEASYIWWRFEPGKKKAPFLVRFDPDGIMVWRPHERDACYRGESLLGLVGGGLRTVDYLSPVGATEGASPDETEETQGSKPLRIDILSPRGKEMITARDGVVELRSARKQLLKRWKTTLPRGSAACTQAAYHRFESEPVILFFEIEFTDDATCDEGWGRREVQQTVFEIRGTELVPIVFGGTSASGTDDGEIGTTVTLDVRIPTGDGTLRYVGSGKTLLNEVGGDEYFDCSAWASDLGVDAADTGFSDERHSGTWSFEVDGVPQAIGPVSATARTYQCTEAQ